MALGLVTNLMGMVDLSGEQLIAQMDLGDNPGKAADEKEAKRAEYREWLKLDREAKEREWKFAYFKYLFEKDNF